jgi:DNA topoisomerase-1
VTLIAEGRSGSKGRAAQAGPVKSLGAHPELGDKVDVYAGRYGPYVKCGKVNATLPKELAPEAVTMEDAVKLIAARIAAGGGKKKPRSSSAAGGGAKKKKPAAKAKAAKTETSKTKSSAVNGKSAKPKASKSAKTPKAAARKTETKAANGAQ